MDRVVRSAGDLFRIFADTEFLTFANFDPPPQGIAKTPKYGATFGTWFRGQGDANWPLQPSIFRRAADLDEGLAYWILRLDSPEQRAICKTTFDWLCLMRHHALPTRLLDWSENALVALYMACEDQNVRGRDGALWIINTLRLHEASRPVHVEAVSICLPHLAEVALRAQMATESDHHAYIAAISRIEAESAFDGPTLDDYRSRLQGPAHERQKAYAELATPVAVYPYRLAGRMSAQRSVFTLHGAKGSVGVRHTSPSDLLLPPPVGLQELDANVPVQRKFLRTLVIPSDAKERILSELDRVGMNEKTLFPEMDAAVR